MTAVSFFVLVSSNREHPERQVKEKRSDSVNCKHSYITMTHDHIGRR